MKIGRTPFGLAVALCVAAAMPLVDLPYGVGVVEFVPGTDASQEPEAALGVPQGGTLHTQGSDALSLGSGGSLTLALGSPAVNGAGTDLVVCENAFYKFGTAQTFAEVAFVEVSSDGTSFARFPTRYGGPGAPIGDFGTVEPSAYAGFTGSLPVTPGTGVSTVASPWDVAGWGGDAFDLEALADHPLVLSNDLWLDNIRFVRIVDAVAGDTVDSAGITVWDSGIIGHASADIDGVVAVNHAGNLNGSRPRVEMDLAGGVLTIGVHDIDGLVDVKLGLTASVNGFPLSFWTLFPLLTLTELSPAGFTLSSVVPIPPGVFPCHLKVSAIDGLGLRGGDAVAIP